MTDENLMSIKIAIDLHSGNAVAILKEDLVGLIGRLEAAEAVYAAFEVWDNNGHDLDCCCKECEATGPALQAWRRVAGKEKT